MDPLQPDPTAAAQPSTLQNILGIALPVLAGVANATRPSLGIGRGVNAALGVYSGVSEQMRMKQALDEAKAKQQLAQQNFGRLADYYTAPPGGVQVAGPADTAVQGVQADPKIKSFAQEHGLSTEPGLFPPEEAAFYKSLFAVDKTAAIAALSARANQERKPRMSEVMAAQVGPGTTLEATTSEGMKVTRKGAEAKPSDSYFTNAQGHRIQTITDLTTGKPIGPPNDLGPVDRPPELDTHVVTDPKTGIATFFAIDKRNLKKPPLRIELGQATTPDALGEFYKNIRDKAAMRAIGKSSGDAQVDAWLKTPQEAGAFLDQLARGDPLMAAIADKIRGAPAGQPAGPPKAPGGTADDRLKAKLGMQP